MMKTAKRSKRGLMIRIFYVCPDTSITVNFDQMVNQYLMIIDKMMMMTYNDMNQLFWWKQADDIYKSTLNLNHNHDKTRIWNCDCNCNENQDHKFTQNWNNNTYSNLNHICARTHNCINSECYEGFSKLSKPVNGSPHPRPPYPAQSICVPPIVASRL